MGHLLPLAVGCDVVRLGLIVGRLATWFVRISRPGPNIMHLHTCIRACVHCNTVCVWPARLALATS